MKIVGIRELKNKLSEYIHLVRRGENILVTDRGEVVAEIHQPSSNILDQPPYPGLLELAREGKVRIGAPNDPSLYPSRPVQTPDGTAAGLIEQDRNGR